MFLIALISRKFWINSGSNFVLQNLRTSKTDTIFINTIVIGNFVPNFIFNKQFLPQLLSREVADSHVLLIADSLTPLCFYAIKSYFSQKSVQYFKFFS